MNVLYATDEIYVRHAAASMISLCEHSKSAPELTVHLLSMGVSEESLEHLRDMLLPFGRTLMVHELGDLKKWFDFSVNPRGFRMSALARLFLGSVLPHDMDRVLYLDCDTLVVDDLSQLWELDMRGCAVAMVEEPTVNHRHRRELGLRENQPYFNSGVQLIDLKRWRREHIEKTVLDYYCTKGGDLLAPVQDALSGALAGRIRTLPPRYNFGSVQLYYPWRTQARLCGAVPFYNSREAYHNAAFPPAIVHFLGEERPWREGNRHPYREAYEAALSQTFWKDMPMESGWKTYFFFFYAFSALTRPFPWLRWKLIDLLIPAFMRSRERKRSAADE